jgi:hypothetical protein
MDKPTVDDDQSHLLQITMTGNATDSDKTMLARTGIIILPKVCDSAAYTTL